MFNLLLVCQALVATTMIGLILMQKSEGGGLGVGGSPSGMLSARGAADFLTRATTICAIAFVGLSIALAGLASASGTSKINVDAAKNAVAPASAVPLETAPAAGSVLNQSLTPGKTTVPEPSAGQPQKNPPAPSEPKKVPLEQ